MSSNRTLMVLPGDGVGPEVVKETLRVVDWLAKNKSISFNIKEGLVGGASYDKYGSPLTDETLADSIDADAILFGAVGGPKYEGVPFEKRPENGILKLRR
jgi:3-isopropylmalate dehydrogenase